MKGDCYSEERLFVSVDLLVAFAVKRTSSNGGDNAECSTSVSSAVRFLSRLSFSHLGSQDQCIVGGIHQRIPFISADVALSVKWVTEVPGASGRSVVILTIAAHSVKSVNCRLPVAGRDIELPETDTFAFLSLVT